jgi:type IV pilus assembly protein PilB
MVTAANIRNVRIGDVLKEYGYITDEQLEQALVYQKTHEGVRLGGALIALGLITESQMLEALAKRLDLKKVDLQQITIDPAAVAKIPQQLAEKYCIMAVSEQQGRLVVVMNDPLNLYATEDVHQLTGMDLILTLSETEPLKKAIHYYYAEVSAREAAKKANDAKMEQAPVEELTLEAGDDDTPVINLLNSLLRRAYSTHTSDIHIEPYEEKTMVRMRIDGTLVEYVTLQRSLHASLIARIKIMAELDIAERRIPQDGHFRVKIDNTWLNIRVSLIPTVFGEKAVLRLLASNVQIDYASCFGMNDESYARFSHMLESPNGMLYLTGPTGSGKSTTLYMVLEQLSKKQVNISTIEDPVEKNVPHINQMQVNHQTGLTFESGLRALLRQDPDVIMIGETRDNETAEIAARAAITGHLVLSTLHTNDAVSSVMRLEDMGLEKYMVASSLVGVVAQRLMRKVCPHCSTLEAPTWEEQQYLGPEIRQVRRAKGCALCNHTGYSGRIAIHEIFAVDREVRHMIMSGASTDELKDYAVNQQGMKTLKECGLEMVKNGISTVEELKKVAYYE